MVRISGYRCLASVAEPLPVYLSSMMRYLTFWSAAQPLVSNWHSQTTMQNLISEYVRLVPFYVALGHSMALTLFLFWVRLQFGYILTFYDFPNRLCALRAHVSLGWSANVLALLVSPRPQPQSFRIAFSPPTVAIDESPWLAVASDDFLPWPDALLFVAVLPVVSPFRDHRDFCDFYANRCSANQRRFRRRPHHCRWTCFSIGVVDDAVPALLRVHVRGRPVPDLWC